jgi:hypothetical protein
MTTTAKGTASNTPTIPKRAIPAIAQRRMRSGLIPSVLDIIEGMRILFSVHWTIAYMIQVIINPFHQKARNATKIAANPDKIGPI